MQTRLPLVAPHARSHTYCTYCPKLCRHACPVSTVQARETTTPWGKMSTLHHAAEGNLPMSPEHAEVFWACTGCLRCRSFCDHENDVPAALHAGRAEALGAGVAPEPAARIARDHGKREARAIAAADAVMGATRRAPTGATAFVPGCTACVRVPDNARAAARVTEHCASRGRGAEVSRTFPGCCGLPLFDAGDIDGFVRAATKFVDALRPAKEAIFEDPGCLYAIKVTAQKLGVRIDLPMRHVSEVAFEHLASLGTTSLAGPARYQDPCKLGRGLGVYDAPRAVISHVLGRAVDEFADHGPYAECSGAGGLLPVTDRATSDAIAAERVESHARAGGGTVITACAASHEALRKNGARVVDFSVLIARAIE